MIVTIYTLYLGNSSPKTFNIIYFTQKIQLHLFEEIGISYLGLVRRQTQTKVSTVKINLLCNLTFHIFSRLPLQRTYHYNITRIFPSA